MYDIASQVNLLNSIRYMEESIMDFRDQLERAAAELDPSVINTAVQRSEEMRKSLEALTKNQAASMRAYFKLPSPCPSSASSSAS